MYYNVLSQLKNAARARRDSVLISYSKMDYAVAKILAQNGFLREVQRKSINERSMLELKLAYENKAPLFTDFRIISKPSRRLYYGYRDIRPIRNNFGLGVLSTPSGVMTNRDARKQKVGGEYLFQVW